MIQTGLSERNAINLLALNISDVREDIIDASDENLLELTHEIAEKLNQAERVTDEFLIKLAMEYDVTEINRINSEGIIEVSTNPDFFGYDMKSGAQSAAFMVLIAGESEYIQSYQPLSYDASISRKYGGVALTDGGFVQVGYGAERFQKDIDEFVVGVTRNRHVGEDGSVIIVNEAQNIVSDRLGNEGKSLETIGVFLDTSTTMPNKVFLADVSGKGIPAAMFMMTAKTFLKSYAESGMRVEEVFTHANDKLCEGNDANMFVTAWMGFLNTKTGVVSYANAGHNPPLVKHADGTVTYLKSRPGFVLAGMEGVRYRRNEIQLLPGDVIYLYTDGITEATNAENVLYGEERLCNVVNLNKNATPQVLCSAVKADVDEFVGEAPQFDDITMLCLAYMGEEKDGEK